MKHGRFSPHTVTLAAVGGLILLLNACAPSATYPPVETTAKLAKPTFEPVPTVLATAIRFVQENYTKGQDLAINLPQGVPAEAYDKVFEKLGGGRPMMIPDEPAIHIQEVRTRNFNAQADVIYARADGFNQLVTLTMKRTMFENFRVERVRPWQLRDVMAMAPNYVAPPTPPTPPEPAEESETDESAPVEETASHAAMVLPIGEVHPQQ